MHRLFFRVAAATAAAVAFAGPVLAQAGSGTDRYGYGPHMMWWDGGWSMFFFGPLFMILVLAAVVAAVVLIVRGFGGAAPGSAPPPAPPNRALDILKERFAKGEIDKAEFEERRRVLGE